MILKYESDDVNTITLSFYQHKYDIMQSKFKLTDDEISELAALQIAATYGNIPHEQVREKLETDIGEFVPQSKLRQKDKAYWNKTIMDQIIKIESFFSKMQAREEYLKIIQKNLMYESHLFYVKVLLFYN
jgi:hypothetical protein